MHLVCLQYQAMRTMPTFEIFFVLNRPKVNDFARCQQGKIVEQIGKLRSAKFSVPEYSQYTCPSTKNISLKEKAVTVFAKWNHAIRIIQKYASQLRCFFGTKSRQKTHWD